MLYGVDAHVRVWNYVGAWIYETSYWRENDSSSFVSINDVNRIMCGIQMVVPKDRWQKYLERRAR